MRILVLGGTGFIGTPLTHALAERGHEVLVSTRRPVSGSDKERDGRIRLATWNGRDATALIPLLDGTDAVVNLLGESLATGKWTPEEKRRIVESRTQAGEALTFALNSCQQRGLGLPSTLIQASASGYYGLWPDASTAPLCEEDTGPGSGFLADTVRAWEASTEAAESMGIRRCRIRTAPVLGPGGFVGRLIPSYRWFAGGVPGTGRQPLPWIHRADEVAAIVFLLEHEETSGAYNLCSPELTTMSAFCHALGRAMHRPVWVPLPAGLLHSLFGDMADEVLLSGQRTVPARLLDAGFAFGHVELEAALDDALHDMRHG